MGGPGRPMGPPKPDHPVNALDPDVSEPTTYCLLGASDDTGNLGVERARLRHAGVDR